MNLSGLKKKFAKNVYEKQLKINLSKPLKYKKKEKIKSIGILTITPTVFEIESLVEKHNYKEYFAEKLCIHADNIKLLFFSESEKHTQESAYAYFTKNNLGWKGNFTKQEIIEFIEEPFDLLINYTVGNNCYLNLIMQQSKADLKVGFSGNDDRILDVIIKVEEQNKTKFNDELFKYLRVLKKI